MVGDQVPTSRPVTWTREDPPGGGPAAGLLAGLDRFLPPPDLVVVLAVDMPRLNAGTVARLTWAVEADAGRRRRRARRRATGAARRWPRSTGTPRSTAARPADRGGRARPAGAAPRRRRCAWSRCRRSGEEARDVDTWESLRDLHANDLMYSVIQSLNPRRSRCIAPVSPRPAPVPAGRWPLVVALAGGVCAVPAATLTSEVASARRHAVTTSALSALMAASRLALGRDSPSTARSAARTCHAGGRRASRWSPPRWPWSCCWSGSPPGRGPRLVADAPCCTTGPPAPCSRGGWPVAAASRSLALTVPLVGTGLLGDDGRRQRHPRPRRRRRHRGPVPGLDLRRPTAGDARRLRAGRAATVRAAARRAAVVTADVETDMLLRRASVARVCRAARGRDPAHARRRPAARRAAPCATPSPTPAGSRSAGRGASPARCVGLLGLVALLVPVPRLSAPAVVRRAPAPARSPHDGRRHAGHARRHAAVRAGPVADRRPHPHRHDPARGEAARRARPRGRPRASRPTPSPGPTASSRPAAWSPPAAGSARSCSTGPAGRPRAASSPPPPSCGTPATPGWPTRRSSTWCAER